MALIAARKAEAMTQMGTPAPLDRLAWLDYAKAIGIVLVVFAHASRSVGRTPGLEWSPALQTLDAVIYAFHMPLFFLLAGFAASLQQAQAPALFAKAVLWGIAVPYLVWSAIWIGLKLSLPDAANVPLTLTDLGTILWKPVEHFWFLYHLFFIRAGWYSLQRLSKDSMIIAGAVLVAAAVASVVLLMRRPDLEWFAGFLRNSAIYGLGLVWLPMFLKTWKEGPVLKLALLGMAFCLWGYAIGDASAVLWQAIGGALIVVAVAMLLPQPASLGWRCFAFLGEASLAIYVMHLIFGAATRLALSKAGLLNEPALIICATLAGLALPAVAYWSILSAGKLSVPSLPRYLGLGTATKSAYLSLWPAARPPQPVSSI